VLAGCTNSAVPAALSSSPVVPSAMSLTISDGDTSTGARATLRGGAAGGATGALALDGVLSGDLPLLERTTLLRGDDMLSAQSLLLIEFFLLIAHPQPSQCHSQWIGSQLWKLRLRAIR
jgi:hypothetical protein